MLTGTVVQTLVLFLIVYRTNWNKEVSIKLSPPCIWHKTCTILFIGKRHEDVLTQTNITS